MVIAAGSPITISELEGVLKHLPEPSGVELRICGNFDYSSICRQAEKMVDEELVEKLGDSDSGPLYLKNPSKEKVLKLYQQFQAQEPGVLSELLLEGIISIKSKISFVRAYWYLDGGVRITVTPSSVQASYFNIDQGRKMPEPEYISRLREELAGTKVDFSIITGKR